MSRTSIVDNPAAHRFEHREGDHLAELVYRVDGKTLVLIHTGVPDALGGRGVGGDLVAAAVAKARAHNLVVDPQCPFARSWLRRHPEAHAGIVFAPADPG